MSYGDKDKDFTTAESAPVEVVSDLDRSSAHVAEDGVMLNDPHR